ncbi:MAG: hypothetical protein QNJ72_11625 [Pleurocapsa sp. MO_226.B13]|nr:hypothetical protein [Pleurocapsa sp. MO_226.B13]
MSAKTSQARQLDQINRAERLLATIATLEEQIKNISASGEVAPPGCYLARYQARGQYKAYWYYKLQAQEPIFVSKKEQGKPSRYKHLGAAGTQAHVDGVMMVIRRVQIDELQKSIDALRDSWSDLYSDISDKSDSH